MKLRMVSIENDGSVRIAAEGPLTAEDFLPETPNPLQVLLGAGWSRHRLLLDMSRADYIDSAAIGWLITCHKDLGAAGGRMVLHSIAAKVMRILKTLRIESILPLVEDESAARAAITGSEQ